MNNLAWYAGVNLKRFVEASGRTPTVEHYLVAAWLLAQEQGLTLDDVEQKLILAGNFEAETKKIADKAKTIRELGFDV